MAQAAVHDDSGDALAFAREMVDIAASATRAHPHANRVGTGWKDSPAVADAVHFFTLLHAERPSAASMAAGAGLWAARFGDAFEAERGWLARAAVAAAPPRRLDLVRHERVVRQQRDAMLTLASSERAGCGLGAVAALAADWPAVRQALAQGDAARETDPAIVEALAAAATGPAARRAIGFGVAQMLGVHRALWDLLEAREAASLP